MSSVLLNIRADFNCPLEEAVAGYVDAKRREDQAKKQRIELEERILSLAPAKEEGAQTIEVGGFKLTTTGKLSYKCDDPKALAEACAAAGWPTTWAPVKTKVELDETGCKWLRANEPDAWATVAKFVTVAPAKTAVSVKV